MHFAKWNRFFAAAGISALTSVALVLLAFAFVSRAGAQRATAAQASGSAGSEVERGRYLVEDVAMCGECHSPRDSGGQLKHDAWLQGASTWIRPVAPIQPWADNAPALAGLPSFTDEQFARVLENGSGPQGEVLRPPMHIYHMHHDDAKAIIAYLKTLPAGSR
jgi:mono/diheme cytochrome c family protein